MRKLVALVVAMTALALAPAVANAAPPTSVLDGEVSCGVVTDEGTGGGQVSGSLGQTWCGTMKAADAKFTVGGTSAQTSPAIPTQLPAAPGDPANPAVRSTAQTFDGVPIDVNVAFPDDGTHGPYPLVTIFHGYGGQRLSFKSMQRWLDKGYAVYSQTNRGFHESCGSADAKAADPDCETKGFVRLDDTRYEVRDAQLFTSMLADEDLIQPTKIAATGGSYGGGMAMALAALKDRTMMPDGSLVPWKSPDGTSMSLAVAIPNIPWTDLAYSLVPNGSNVDYIKDASYFGRFGVMKQSYVNGLYLSGMGAPGYYTAPGVQPSADLSGWKAFLDKGEPYDGTAAAEQMLNEVTTHHSSYYIDHSQAPAPLLISSGFTDDLFPANEATRYYNRTRAQFPDAPLGLFFGSFGHMRGQNGSEVSSALTTLENSWVDHYLKGTGSAPASNVTAYSQVCPDAATDGGPFVSSDWASASPGEIRLLDDAGSQTVAPDGGDREVGAAFNPAPAGKACTTADGAKETGTANYELPPAPAGGYTLLGSPTVIAKITLPGDDSQIAARLVDVAPGGATKTLLDRGLWRPAQSGYQVFQLTPNSWKVEAGHVLRLELLPFDGGQADPTKGLLSNYGRPSNDQQPATIENVDLRIPVLDQPGAAGGAVEAPVKKVLPDRPGVELAKGYDAIGSETLADYAASREPKPVVGAVKVVSAPKVKGKKLTVKIKCAIGNDSCAKTSLKFKGAPKKGKKGKNLLVAKRSGITAKPGQTKTVSLKLTKKARKFFKDKKVRKRGKKKTVKGAKKLRVKVLVGGKSAGFKTVKRVGKVK